MPNIRRGYYNRIYNKPKKDYTALIIFASVIGGIIFVMFISFGSHITKKFGEQSVSTTYSVSCFVTAENLLSQYEQNEIAADMQYKGKTVQINGTVRNIAMGLLGDAYITLDTGSLFSIQCSLESSQMQKAARLQRGCSVCVRGIVWGKLGNVLVEHCEIVEW